jgi:LmbE family N-acetylglucosaminyl deacetylase
MVVVAHADDAEYGCSGTVSKWCKEGMEVVYVLCTDGSKGSSDPEMTPERLVEIRRQEQLAAAKVLGVKDVIFLGYADSMLQPTLELRRDIAGEIRRHKPDILICQSPVRSLNGTGYIGHPDHMAAGEAALSAVFPTARDRMTFPELLEEGLEPHKVREVLVMDHGEEADKWIDVSDTIDIATEALKQHVSQVGDNHEGDGWMREWRQRTGQHHGMKYAEAFKHFHFH